MYKKCWGIPLVGGFRYNVSITHFPWATNPFSKRSTFQLKKPQKLHFKKIYFNFTAQIRGRERKKTLSRFFLHKPFPHSPFLPSGCQISPPLLSWASDSPSSLPHLLLPCMDGAAAHSIDRSSHAKLHHDSPSTPPEAAEDYYLYTDSGLSGVPLTEAPILLLIKFHRALRSELADLRRVTLAAAESGCYGGEFVSGLIRRVEFLKLAYKYHCAAEDEVTTDSFSCI